MCERTPLVNNTAVKLVGFLTPVRHVSRADAGVGVLPGRCVEHAPDALVNSALVSSVCMDVRRERCLGCPYNTHDDSREAAVGGTWVVGLEWPPLSSSWTLA